MAVKNIDLSYCLLSDVGCGEFNNGSLSIDSEKKYKHIRFMINNQTYRAPDLFSAKLYRWQKEFFEERFPSCTTSFDTDKYSNGKITVQVNDSTFHITPYCIGFSEYLIPELVELDLIEKYLKTTKTFVGHIILPRGFDKGWF